MTIRVVPPGATDGCVGSACLGSGAALPDGEYVLTLEYPHPNGAIHPSVEAIFTVTAGAPTLVAVRDPSIPDPWEIADVRISGAGGHLSVSWDVRAR